MRDWRADIRARLAVGRLDPASEADANATLTTQLDAPAWVTIGAAALLVASGAAASVVPARRASRVDPVVALRSE